MGHATVERTRKQFVEGGLSAALLPQQAKRSRPLKLDGEQEAHLIAVCCSAAPKGRKRWSLRMLANRLVELEIVEQISHETVRAVLKKNQLKPWQKKQWSIPPEQNAEFVANMEDILEVYKRPYDPKRPQICMDEVNTQLLKEIRDPIPSKSGKVRREDYEYQREGVCNVFLAVEPLSGKRFTQVRKQRTRSDWAHFMRKLLDEHYRQAEKVVLVMDNLNTHLPASFYEVFAPSEASG